MIFEGLPTAPSTAHDARSASATELRRSRCWDGVVAATELRRPAPSRLFCASRPRQSWCCCDGADAARSAAATELRRSGCCDGAAQTSSVALILRVASATELMLLRRSWCCCDGAGAARSAAATELRRSRCCDGAAQTSSVALILRVASRRDALNEEPASFSLPLIQISSRGPQS